MPDTAERSRYESACDFAICPLGAECSRTSETADFLTPLRVIEPFRTVT
jgi:hypothetical protein